MPIYTIDTTPRELQWKQRMSGQTNGMAQIAAALLRRRNTLSEARSERAQREQSAEAEQADLDRRERWHQEEMELRRRAQRRLEERDAWRRRQAEMERQAEQAEMEMEQGKASGGGGSGGGRTKREMKRSPDYAVRRAKEAGRDRARAAGAIEYDLAADEDVIHDPARLESETTAAHLSHRINPQNMHDLGPDNPYQVPDRSQQRIELARAAVQRAREAGDEDAEAAATQALARAEAKAAEASKARPRRQPESQGLKERTKLVRRLALAHDAVQRAQEAGDSQALQRATAALRRAQAATDAAGLGEETGDAMAATVPVTAAAPTGQPAQPAAQPRAAAIAEPEHVDGAPIAADPVPAARATIQGGEEDLARADEILAESGGHPEEHLITQGLEQVRAGLGDDPRLGVIEQRVAHIAETDGADAAAQFLARVLQADEFQQTAQAEPDGDPLMTGAFRNYLK